MEENTQQDKIEDYCLGLLTEKEAGEITLAATQDPVLLQRIEEIEKALLGYGKMNARPLLKDSIMSAISSTPVSTRIDLANPPFINRNSDIADWNAAIAHIVPDRDHGHIKTCFIAYTRDLQLCVAWLYDRLEEAGHQEDEFEESFLILEGSCECHIGGRVYHLKAGDYLDIPFNQQHTIQSTSAEGYVKAIIQRRRSAA